MFMQPGYYKFFLFLVFPPERFQLNWVVHVIGYIKGGKSFDMISLVSFVLHHRNLAF